MFPSRCGAFDGDFFALELARVSRHAAASREPFRPLKSFKRRKYVSEDVRDGERIKVAVRTVNVEALNEPQQEHRHYATFDAAFSRAEFAELVSGVAGVIHLYGSPIDRVLLQRLVEFLRFRGPDAQRIFGRWSCGVGPALPGRWS